MSASFALGVACVGEGGKFDLVIGFDLTKELHQKEVERYIADHRPLVVVLGPPCTSFGHWSYLNQYKHPETWRKSRWIGETRAKFAARVCWIQFRANRHFLVETQQVRNCFIWIALNNYGTLVAWSSVTCRNVH